MLNDKIDITVIIPMYNAEKYISETIHSVLSQQQHNFIFEIIVVNDCSTDESLQIVRKINDNRIRIIDLEKNVGLSEARNTGIRNANGKWIEFLDSDDKICSDLFKKFERTLDEEHNVFMFSVIHEFKNYNLIQKITKIRDKRSISHFGIVVKFFIKRDICIFFEPGYLHEDIIFSFEMIRYGKLKIKLIEDAYYFYNRKNENSITANFKKNEYLKMYEYIFNRVDKCDKLTKMFVLETFVGILKSNLIPKKISIFIAVKTIFKLYKHLPDVIFNGIRTDRIEKLNF